MASGFSFVQITDHHLPERDDALKWCFSATCALRAVLRHIASHVAGHIDFILSTGDLVDNPTAASYDCLRRVLGVTPSSASAPGPLVACAEGLGNMPMYLMPGNHDDRDAFFRSLFPRTRPGSPLNEAFIYQGVQFVCLDWGARNRGAADPAMLSFLRGALAGGKPSVLILHHHLVRLGARWLDELLPEQDDLARFWEIVREGEVLAVLCGHAHITYERYIEGVPVYGLRSTAFSFALQDDPLILLADPHYRLVTIQDGIVTTRVYEVPL